jgi:hypothetical protein
VLALIVNPVKHLVQELMVPEHSAQLELQETHWPLMAVNPLWQLGTQTPLETIPDLHVQTPLTGEAPDGQVV